MELILTALCFTKVGYSRRSLMTLAVNDYVEIANAFCELSTLDTLGNCDSFIINKKDETRKQFGASSDRQGIIHVWYRRTKVSEFSLSRITVSNHFFLVSRVRNY